MLHLPPGHLELVLRGAALSGRRGAGGFGGGGGGGGGPRRAAARGRGRGGGGGRCGGGGGGGGCGLWVLVVLVLRAEEVVEDVDDCRDVALGLAVAVLQSGIQGA